MDRNSTNLTEREQQELFEKLDHASNDELGQIAQYVLRLEESPFVTGLRMLELPSITRDKVIRTIKSEVAKGSVPVAKNN